MPNSSSGGDPFDPLRPIGVAPGSGASAARSSDAVDGAAETDAVGGAARTEAADATVAIDRATDAIADDLAAGRIDPATAQAQLIEDALRTQLPADTDPALVEQIRQELAAALADDPTLRRLLTP